MDIIILIILGILLIVAGRSWKKQRRNGCSGACAGCQNACEYREPDKDNGGPPENN